MHCSVSVERGKQLVEGNDVRLALVHELNTLLSSSVSSKPVPTLSGFRDRISSALISAALALLGGPGGPGGGGGASLFLGEVAGLFLGSGDGRRSIWGGEVIDCKIGGSFLFLALFPESQYLVVCDDENIRGEELAALRYPGY